MIYIKSAVDCGDTIDRVKDLFLCQRYVRDLIVDVCY